MTDLPSTLLLHPGLAVVPGPPARLWHTERARIDALSPPELATLLAAFVRPRRVAEVLGELETQPGGPDGVAWPDLLDRSVRAGVLVDAAPRTPRWADTLFDAPHHTLAEVLID